MILITDIHGCYDTMQALLAKIPQEEKDKGIVVCGDMVDRGPKSKEVIQWCIDNKAMVVLGNHEDLMLKNYESDFEDIKEGYYRPWGDLASPWAYNGGEQTILSYLKGPRELRPIHIDDLDMDTFNKHIEWIKKLPLYLEFPCIKNAEGRHLLASHSSVHAVYKKRNSSKENDQEIFKAHATWGRPSKIDSIKNVYNVFGHTINKEPKIKDCYANIDTGCFYKSHKYGKLTALQFPSMVIYEQEKIDG